jgi:hypothetical protein
VRQHHPLQRVGLNVVEPHRLEGANAHAQPKPQSNPTGQIEELGFRSSNKQEAREAWDSPCPMRRR